MFSKFKQRIKKQPFHYSLGKESHMILPSYSAASLQAEEFHASTKEIRGIFGGDRAGKTGTGAYETVCMMRKFPGTLHWCICLKQSKIRAVFQWHEHWLAKNEYTITGWYSHGKRIPSHLTHTNGSQLEYLTAASGSDTFSADKLKSIHIDEDPDRETSEGEQIYNDCLSRILEDGYLWITATPVLGKNWMYSRIYDRNRSEREDNSFDSDIESWTVSLLDNRFIPYERKMKAKGRMSADEIERRFYGMFTTLSGAIFKEYNEKIHILQDFPAIPYGWRFVKSLDLGYRNPFVCLWGALSPDDILYIYDEYYQAEELVSYHADQIRAKDQQHFAAGRITEDMYLHGYYFECTLSDHEAQTRAELDNAGIYTHLANKKPELSWQVANRHFKIKGDGKPSIYLAPWLTYLPREIQNYHFKKVRDGLEMKEVVDKVDDHAVDAFLYMCMHFWGDERIDYNILTASADEITG